MSTYGILPFRTIERFSWFGAFYFCLMCSCLLAQPGQLDFRHYSIDEGLPSSEVYSVFEDRDGFLWFGTDNGVARFDGYEFTVFDFDEGLEDVVAFNIMEDNNGKLWITTYSGSVFFFEDGKFHPYQYNDIARELKKMNYFVLLLDVTPTGDMVFNIRPTKVIKISPEGKVETLLKMDRFHKRSYLFEDGKIEVTQGLGPVYGYFNPSPFNEIPSTGDIELGIIDVDGSEIIKKIIVSRKEKFFSIRNGSVRTHPATNEREAIFSSNLELFIVPINGGPVRQCPIVGKIVNSIIPGNGEGEYWAFLNRGQGLKQYVFLSGEELPHVSTFLKGHSVSSGIFDRNGGFWVTTLDDGVYYAPYPKQKLYFKDDVTQNSKSISIALTGPESFYAGYDDGSVYKYDEVDMGLWNILKPEVDTNERMSDIFYDNTNGRVYLPFFSFEHPLKQRLPLGEEEVKRYTLIDGKIENYTYFNHFPESFPNKLFASRGLSFAEYKLDENRIVNDSRFLGVVFSGTHVLGVDLNENLLLGTLHGLYDITSEGCMEANNRGNKKLSDRVVFIQHVNQHALLFGTRGNGLVYQGRDTSYQIKESDGLASDNIRDIHKDEDGNFWVSTLNGLSKVSFSEDGHSYNLRTFRTENGLPTNEVSQVDTWGDEVWLATSTGIAHFIEPPLDTISPKPIIRQIWMNGEMISVQSQLDLPAGKQDISVRFSTINYFLGNQVPYRYRINASAPWQYSKERTANYPNLGAGNYQFAVQSRNQDGFWSESTYLDIYVATPWYQSWWAILSGMTLLIVGLSTFFLIRERRRKREQNFLLQINELEHAALHAQMNPHFVFNALNSIQNFVLENDAKQAATYLSRFARIIRQTLRSSVEGEHTLREEMDMLKTYLVLEKLRFKDGFNYELTASPHLPLDDISLPPLLIQPFVENAIIHGLKDRKRGGWISIDFFGSTTTLKVRIEDNGSGFDPANDAKSDSLGMSITRKRLDMMNSNLNDESGMTVEPIKNDNRMIQGTRVTLSIQLKSPTEPSALS